MLQQTPLSGLLKRFESSTGAFISSISKIIEQHKNFLKALDAGYVVSTEFLTESLGMMMKNLIFLDKSTNNYPIEQFNTDLLKKDVKNDLAKLEEIFELLKKSLQKKTPN